MKKNARFLLIDNNWHSGKSDLRFAKIQAEKMLRSFLYRDEDQEEQEDGDNGEEGRIEDEGSRRDDYEGDGSRRKCTN